MTAKDMRTDKIKAYLEEIQDKYKIPGGQVLIRKEHREIYSCCFGWSDYGWTKRTSKEDLYWLYSLTKLYTCTAVLKLAEQGKLEIDQDTASYLPELAAIRIKKNRHLPYRRLTVRHLLSMTAGFGYDTESQGLKRLRERDKGPENMREVIRTIADEGLDFSPGEHFQYSFCHDILGGIIEVVSGKKLPVYMEEEIFRPLGIKSLGFFPDSRQKKRIAAQYYMDRESGRMKAAGKDNLIRIGEGYASGGSGLLGTLEGYMVLPDALSCGGTAENGCQILKTETIREMRRNQLTRPELLQDFYNNFPSHKLEGYGYGLGVRTRIRDTGDSPPGEFGWDGAAGAFVLIDCKNKVSLGYIQHVKDCGPAYSEIHPHLRRMLYDLLQ